MTVLVTCALALSGEIEWLTSYGEALKKSRETGKPILLLAYDTT